jgi:mycothiol synthase
MIAKTEGQTLTLPYAPQIDGLRFRRFEGDSDYPKMVAVIQGCREFDQRDWSITVEQLTANYAHMTNCDPYQDMLFAEVKGQLVAFGRVSWREETEGDYIHNINLIILPAWRHQGLGQAMLRYLEERNQEIARQHPAEAPKYHRSGSSDTEKDKVALLEGAGYQPERYFFTMERPLDIPIPEAPMPEGLEIRPVKPEHFDAILDANDEAFQDHWGHTPMTEEDRKGWLEHPQTQPELWKVAWDGDQVAGMVLNVVDEDENKVFQRKRAYTEDIAVRRPWRQRGLATALIAESMRMFKEQGYEEVSLGVDTDNPSGALKLYESLGYQVSKRYTSYRKPLELGD